MNYLSQIVLNSEGRLHGDTENAVISSPRHSPALVPELSTNLTM